MKRDSEGMTKEPPASQRKRVAIYGGSFNPITNAHLNVAAEIVHSQLADEVWVTPCGKRPDKPSLNTSMIHRLVMCHLAVDSTFGSHFPIKVCDEEAELPRMLPSLLLMQRLAKNYPDIDFYFACGSDLFETMRTWTIPEERGLWEADEHGGQKLWDETRFIILDRPGPPGEAQTELPPHGQRVSEALEARGGWTLTETKLSSTEVRVRIEKRSPDEVARDELQKPGYHNVEGLVPSVVLAHIVRYGLYK